MSFSSFYRLSSHAVFTNKAKSILQLKQTYNDKRWGLPGGSPEPGETVNEALIRECREELGIDVEIEYLSGIYYHSEFNSHVFIFKCKSFNDTTIKLSAEHSEYKYFEINDLSEIQKIRVLDCLNYNGNVISRKF